MMKLVFWGLFIWFIPFIISVGLWDPATGAPTIDIGWFNTIMALSWAIAFSIAACSYFTKVHTNDYKKEAYIAALTWFLVLTVADFIVLVNVFGMPIDEYKSIALFYLNTVILTIMVGHILARTHAAPERNKELKRTLTTSRPATRKPAAKKVTRRTTRR